MINIPKTLLTAAADIAAGGADTVPVICDVAGRGRLRHREGWAAVWCCNIECIKNFIPELF